MDYLGIKNHEEIGFVNNSIKEYTEIETLAGSIYKFFDKPKHIIFVRVYAIKSIKGEILEYVNDVFGAVGDGWYNIMRRGGIRETIHKFLLDNYSHLYLNLDTTTIIKQDGDGNVSDMSDVSGYRLLIPMDEKVEVKNGDNKVVLANAVKVSDPQIYLQGIQNNVCEFVKIGGKTHTWNTKESKFTK